MISNVAEVHNAERGRVTMRETWPRLSKLPKLESVCLTVISRI